MDTHIRLLLVDDEQIEYLLIGNLLAEVFHTAYEITWLSKIEEALPEFLSENYDVILLDYNWGEDSAKALLMAARAKGCKTPVVVMTDEMEAEVDREAISVGAADYLIKGRIDSQLIERTIRYAIERKSNEMRLAELAHFDPLTGVSNRILFRDRLDHAVGLATRGGQSFTLMYLDLDGFKPVNDCYGHDVGDQLIHETAMRLQECVRTSDTVARVGGDEFTLLLENMQSTTDMAHLADKVIESLCQPFALAGMEITVGCSVGIAPYRRGCDAETLQRQADMAMYRAKKANGNQYCFYAESMDQDARRLLQMEQDMRRGLGRGEFGVYYQPRIDVITGEVCALEALVRWRHPAQGLLTPHVFLSVADASGLIVELGYQVIREICRDYQSLQSSELAAAVICVNLSQRQLRDERLIDTIVAELDRNKMNGNALEFEISEEAIMSDLMLATMAMGTLAVTGARFTLDDFGSGMSSLVALQRLPLGRVKIDGSLVSGVNASSEEHGLVMAVVQLAHSLKLKVVAESVESADQLKRLRELGCDEAHGYWLGAPQPLAEIMNNLAPAQVETPLD